MFRRTNRGSLLAGAFLVSVALGVAMVGLLVASRTANKQAESLLSKSYLSRMAREKLTQDLLTLPHVSTTPVQFPLGEAEAFARTVPGGLNEFGPSVYLVVVATLTKNNLPQPRHLRLETLVEVTAATNQAATSTVGEVVDGYLLKYFSEEDPRFEEVKKLVMEQLRQQMGALAQYRDPSALSELPASQADDPGLFYMQPVSVAAAAGPRVRLWKETNY